MGQPPTKQPTNPCSHYVSGKKLNVWTGRIQTTTNKPLKTMNLGQKERLARHAWTWMAWIPWGLGVDSSEILENDSVELWSPSKQLGECFRIVVVVLGDRTRVTKIITEIMITMAMKIAFLLAWFLWKVWSGILINSLFQPQKMKWNPQVNAWKCRDPLF